MQDDAEVFMGDEVFHAQVQAVDVTYVFFRCMLEHLYTRNT